MKRKTILFLIPVFAFCLILLCGCGKVDLTENGKSEYVVVMPDGASAAVKQAAREVSDYIHRISGANLKVIKDSEPETEKEILVGATNRNSKISGEGLGAEEYLVALDGNKLVFTGGGDRGILYGVYSFFEENYNCFWFASDCFTCDKDTDISLKSDFRMQSKPAFEYRDSYWACSYNSVWSAYNKINSNQSRSLGAEYGGGISYAGFVHTFSHYIPADEFFETHPEYFSMVGGRRVSDKQLCLSNPDVLAITIERVKERLRANPHCKIVSVSQNDTDGPCTCPECRKVYEEEGSYSGSILRFVNAVADAIKDEFPDVAVDTLAYRYSRSAPKKTVPRDNVIVRLCTIECCFSHPIADCDYEKDSSVMELSDNPVDLDLEAWGELTDRVYVWDYTTNFAYYIATFPNFGVLQANLQYFKEHGVAGVFEQGDYQNMINCEFGDLRSYLLAKLLWDPYCDLDYYRDKFMKAYYGAASDLVQEYLDTVSAAAEENHFGIYTTPKEMYRLSKEQRDALTQLWDQAEEITAEDKRAYGHVCRSRLSYDYYLFGNEYVEGYTTKQELTEMREAFYWKVKKFGLTMFHENFSEMKEPNFAGPVFSWD